MTEYRDSYSAWRQETFTGTCGWSGLGASIVPEIYAEVLDYQCPGCFDEAVLIISIPTEHEIRAAAAVGNQEAVEQLASLGRARSATDPGAS